MERLTGWVEDVVDGRVSGWYQSLNEKCESKKYIVINIRGEKVAKIELFTQDSVREDLSHLKNVESFYFEMEEELFLTHVPISNISFYIVNSNGQYRLRILPKLTMKCIHLKQQNTKSGICFGRESDDKNIVIGAGGTLFLSKGRNNVQEIYNKDFRFENDEWLDTISERQSNLAELKSKYFQIFIPEKSSFLYWKTPFKSSSGSPAYNELVHLIDKHFKGTLIDLLEVSKSSPDITGLFQEFDSHLSTFGARLFFEFILSKIIEEQQLEYTLSEPVFTKASGDLGGRFARDGHITDSNINFKTIILNNSTTLRPELVFSSEPKNGVIGNHRVWKCENAPLDYRVVCFGNSFFERGTSSSCLSWWFARFFREFHFVWSPDYDCDYIKQVKPDITLCQTVERFLIKTPRK